MRTRQSQPRLCPFDRATAIFNLPELRHGVQSSGDELGIFGRKERRDLCGGSDELDIIRGLRNPVPGGHFMSQPPRHAQLICVDSCSSRFHTAIRSGRFTPAARQKAEVSIREASCLQVLTTTLTRLPRASFQVKNPSSATRVQRFVRLFV